MKDPRICLLGSLSWDLELVFPCLAQRFKGLSHPWGWLKSNDREYQIRAIVIHHDNFGKEDIKALRVIRSKYLQPIVLLGSKKTTAEVARLGLGDIAGEDPNLLPQVVAYLLDLQDRALSRLSPVTSFEDMLRAVDAVLYRNPRLSRMQALKFVACGEKSHPALHVLDEQCVWDQAA